MDKPRILIVDDEPDVRERLISFISRKVDCLTEEAQDGWEALEKLKNGHFDLVILDIKMPGLSGIDVLREAAKFSAKTRFLAISGYDSHDVASEALKAGAMDFISKPQTPESIALKVREILEAIAENKDLPQAPTS